MILLRFEVKDLLRFSVILPDDEATLLANSDEIDFVTLNVGVDNDLVDAIGIIEDSCAILAY